MPQDNGQLFSGWSCHICGIADNHGWRSKCRRCEAYPAPGARKVRSNGGGAKGGGGKGGGDVRAKGHPSGSNPSNGKGGNQLGDYATRQLQLQRSQQFKSAHKASERELADARRRNEALQENYRKLQQEVEELKRSRAGKAIDEEMDVVEGPSEYTQEERKSRMDRIRNSLPYLEDQFGAESDEYRAAVDELYVHEKTLRGEKPYKTHRTILERKVDKLRRQQEKEKDHLSELREAAEEIKSKIEAAESAIDSRDRELEAAEAELKDLLLRAVGEDVNGTTQTQQAPVDPTTGWNTVIETVGRLAQQPGVPAQFTAQLDGLFGQLQQMVQVLSHHAAVSGGNPLQPGQPGAPSYASVAAGAQPAKDDEVVPQLQPAQAEELRQQQRLAGQQRKQTAAINRFISSHRASSSQHLQQQQPHQQQQHQQHQEQQHLQQEQARAQQQEAAAAAAAASTAHTSASAAAAATAATVGGTAGSPGEVAPMPPTPLVPQPAVDGSSTPAATGAATQPQPTETVISAPQPSLAEPPSECGDAESDITGAASESDGEGMDIEAVLDNIPQSQKAAVRKLLEAKKAKRVRRLQRLKKPVMEQGAAAARQHKKK